MSRVVSVALLVGLVALTPAPARARTLAGVDLPGNMEPAIAEFTSLIDDVSKGDVLSFTWRPGTGVEIAKNDTVRGTIAGDDFARTLFTVWFGPEPGDANLKHGMLGK